MKRVMVVPGDDAAAEAVLATMTLLISMQLPISWILLEPGESLSPDMADSCDSVLFGATNGSTKGLGHLRVGWGTYANVRPVKWRRGVPSALRRPEGIDYIIVREALEDVYVGIEGRLTDLVDAVGPQLSLEPRGELGAPHRRFPLMESTDGRFSVKVYTKDGIERVARFAGMLATRRLADGHPGRVTIGGKWNVNPRTDGYFLRVAEATIAAFPNLKCDTYLADDLGRRLVMSPQEFDVILLPNLYGDVLSDVAVGAIGGLGIAPSGGYGAERAYFEPVHGSAPDLVGRNLINPTATLLSAAMLLEYLSLGDHAAALERAVNETLSEGRVLTSDLGGSATTTDFVSAVGERCSA